MVKENGFRFVLKDFAAGMIVLVVFVGILVYVFDLLLGNSVLRNSIYSLIRRSNTQTQQQKVGENIVCQKHFIFGTVNTATQGTYTQTIERTNSLVTSNNYILNYTQLTAEAVSYELSYESMSRENERHTYNCDGEIASLNAVDPLILSVFFNSDREKVNEAVKVNKFEGSLVSLPKKITGTSDSPQVWKQNFTAWGSMVPAGYTINSPDLGYCYKLTVEGNSKSDGSVQNVAVSAKEYQGDPIESEYKGLLAINMISPQNREVCGDFSGTYDTTLEVSFLEARVWAPEVGPVRRTISQGKVSGKSVHLLPYGANMPLIEETLVSIE